MAATEVTATVSESERETALRVLELVHRANHHGATSPAAECGCAFGIVYRMTAGADRKQPLLMTHFRPVAEAPRGGQTKVLLKTAAGIVLTGIVFEDGTPGIYDFCTDRYIQRPSWFGLTGWMPLPC